MKRLLIFILLTSAAFAQAVRVDPTPIMRTSGTAGPGGFPQLLAVPNVAVRICTNPANAVPCTNFAPTFTTLTSGTPCPGTAPLVLQGGVGCVSATDSQGNWGFYANPGTYAYTITLPSSPGVTGGSFGPYILSVGGTGGGGGGGGPICAISGISTPIYAGCYGVSTTNTGAQNNAALLTTFAAAYTPGQAHPADVILPCGTLQVDTPVNPTPITHIWGCGRGDNSALIPPNGNGTVIQADGTFHCPNATGSTSANCAVVILGGDGASSTELFDSQIHNLGIDANNIANTTFMMANCQEQCYYDHIILLNIKKYGFFLWGANNNSNDSTHNSAWGLPALYQGQANNHGGDMEIYGNEAVTSATVPYVLANAAGFLQEGHLSIVMLDPTQGGGAHTPNICSAIWGADISMLNVHCEGPLEAYDLGPPGLQYGNGLSRSTFQNIQYSSSANGCLMHIMNAIDIAITGAGNQGGFTICDDASGPYHGNDTSWFSDNRFSNNFHEIIAPQFGISLDANIATTANVTASGNIIAAGQVKSEGTNPILATQNTASVSFVDPFHSFVEDTSGNLHINSTPQVMSNPFPLGDIFVNGMQSIVSGIGQNYSGLNYSAPGDATNNVMTLLGQNLAYNYQTSQFVVSFNGQPEFSGWIGGLDGWRFCTDNNTTAGNYSPASILAKCSLFFDNTRLSHFGNTSISGPVTSFTNSTGACNVNPTTTALVCTSDRRTKKNISPMDGALAKIMLLKPSYFQWKSQSAGAPRQAGFIAQDVRAVMPNLVSSIDDTLTLNQMGLIPYLVKAVQEEQKEIESLRAQIKALKH